MYVYSHPLSGLPPDHTRHAVMCDPAKSREDERNIRSPSMKTFIIMSKPSQVVALRENVLFFLFFLKWKISLTLVMPEDTWGLSEIIKQVFDYRVC